MRAPTRWATWGLGPLAALILAAGSVPGRAAEPDETVFERVGDYEVTLDRKPAGLNPCRIGRAYKDPRDHDAENAVVIGRIGEAFVISLVYEKWNWQKGKSYRARFSIDDTVIEPDAQWVGQGMALVLTTPAAILPRLRAGKRIVLGFRDGDADFELAGFSPAYDAMLRCDAAARGSGAERSGAESAEAKDPNAGKLTAYAFGLMMQTIVRDCDVPTTARQRASLDARVSALQAELAAYEAAMRDQVKRRTGTCPDAGGAGDLQRKLDRFIETPPEAFAAEIEKGAEAAK